jgi:hypothetical protein
MGQQDICLYFRLSEKFPGIVPSVIMEKYIPIQASHEHFEQYNRRSMIDAKGKPVSANHPMKK